MADPRDPRDPYSIEGRIVRLLDQLEDVNLTLLELEQIKRKVEFLRSLQK